MTERPSAKKKGTGIRRFIMYGVDYLKIGAFSIRENCYYAIKNREKRKPIEIAQQYGLPTNGHFDYKKDYLFGDWNGEKEHIAGKIGSWLHESIFGQGGIPASLVEKYSGDLAFLRGVVTQGEYDRFRNDHMKRIEKRKEPAITDTRSLMAWLLNNRELIDAETEQRIRSMKKPGMGVTEAIGLFPKQYQGILMARYRADKGVETGKADDMKSLVKTVTEYVSVFDEEKPETYNHDPFDVQ